MTETETPTEPPGSQAAIERGCTCDPEINAGGRGAHAEYRAGFHADSGDTRDADGGADARPVFMADNDCPLHGIAALLIALPAEADQEPPNPDELVPNPMVGD